MAKMRPADNILAAGIGYKVRNGNLFTLDFGEADGGGVYLI